MAAIETLSFPQPHQFGAFNGSSRPWSAGPLILRDEFERHIHLHYAIRPADSGL
jgi:hypothetical protein